MHPEVYMSWLLNIVMCLATKSCLTLCDFVDCSTVIDTKRRAWIKKLQLWKKHSGEGLGLTWKFIEMKENLNSACAYLSNVCASWQ